MDSGRVVEELTPAEKRHVQVFREAVRKLTGTAPTVEVYRRVFGYRVSEQVFVDLGSGGYQGSTVQSALSWALWCVAETACEPEQTEEP